MILVLAISVIDRLTGHELQVQVLQLIPIALITWALGRYWGLGLSVVAVALWLTVFRGDHHYSSALYFYWDGLVLLATFSAFVLLLARLREALRSSEVSFLEKLDAPAYVADLQVGKILYTNPVFRDSLAGRSLEELARYPAKESVVTWTDGRRALLRIVTL